MSRLFQRAIAFVVVAMVAGCSAYRLGPPEGTRSGTIYIAPVLNETQTPQVRALLTEQLRSAFSRTPGWRLAENEDAEYVLEVAVQGFDQEIAATREEDTARGLSFEMQLTARYLLHGPGQGDAEPRTATASGIHFDTPGQPESLYQALPSVTAKIAEQIHASVTHSW